MACVYYPRRILFRLLTSCLRQGLNPATKRLEITTTANQDPLLTHTPIIGVDIWEHAFYLQYLNVKADVRLLLYICSCLHYLTLNNGVQYLNAIWAVINFDEAESRYIESAKL
jgi:superoxide dismutase, Fe-Mn family